MKVLIFVLLTAVFASAAAPVCMEYYSKKSIVKNQIKKDKELTIKDIVKNKKGEIIKARVEITTEVTPDVAALKMSEILRQLDGIGKVADILTVDVATNLTLIGQGSLYGLEVDITPLTTKVTMTINLEQNVARIAEGQEFTSILTEKNASEAIVVNLSGEVKEMDKKAKVPKEQKCKGT